MDELILREPREPHVLPDAEIDRLLLLAIATETLIAHAEELEERARLVAEERRAAEELRAA